MNRFPLKRSPARNRPATRTNHICPPVICMFRQGSILGHGTKNLAVEPEYTTLFGAAERRSILNKGIQDWLKIECRPANDLEHLTGGRLLIQRLGKVTIALLQFFEQPHVLDGDDGLIGESFEKSDLLIGERADVRSADMNCADRQAFAKQWRDQNSSNLAGPKAIRKFGARLRGQNVMDVHGLSVDHCSAARDRASHRST